MAGSLVKLHEKVWECVHYEKKVLLLQCVKQMFSGIDKAAILRSAVWVLFLVFFTYTPVIVALFVTDKDVLCTYYEMQKAPVSLLVNFGLLGMVVWDYFSVKPTMDIRVTICLFVGLLALFVIFFHANIMFTGTGKSYSDIINNDCLSFIAHFILLLAVGYLKYLSAKEPHEKAAIVVTPVCSETDHLDS